MEQEANAGHSRNGSPDDDLNQRTVSGLGWKFTSIGMRFAAQFGISVVLARLLPPEDFGLMGLAMVATGFGNTFVKMGLGPALIQRQQLNRRHVRVAFTISVILGVVCGGLLYIVAPLAARFFQEPRVTPILRLLVVDYLLLGFLTVSKALLQRQLSFRKIFYVEFASSAVIRGGLGVTLAVTGFGVWSLVYASLARRMAVLVLSYRFTRHDMRPLISFKEIRELAHFGTGQTLTKIASYFALKGDYLVVGRVLGPGPLGLYTRAYNLMTLPTAKLMRGLGSVLFPAASKIQHDRQRFRRAYLYMSAVVSFTMIPIMAVLVVLAPELITGIYGEKWAGAIAPLQILVLSGFFRAAYKGGTNFLQARGWVYRLFACQFIYGTCIVGGGWIATVYFGLEGTAGAVGIAIFVMWILVSYFTNRATGTSTPQLLKTLVPGVALALPLTVACVASKFLLAPLATGPLWVVLIAGMLGTGAMGAALLYLPQRLFAHLPRRMLRTLEGTVPVWAEGMHRRLLSRFDEAGIGGTGDGVAGGPLFTPESEEER